jgi:DNA-binding YbaB/EbfC family protein
MGYGFNGGFGGANIQNLMRQAQRMQAEMEEKKAQLDVTEFRASVGGGMVEVVMMGNRTIKSLTIKPEVVDPDDVEMLQDLVISAVNDALNQIAKAEKESMPQVPGM